MITFRQCGEEDAIPSAMVTNWLLVPYLCTGAWRHGVTVTVTGFLSHGAFTVAYELECSSEYPFNTDLIWLSRRQRAVLQPPPACGTLSSGGPLLCGCNGKHLIKVVRPVPVHSFMGAWILTRKLIFNSGLPCTCLALNDGGMLSRLSSLSKSNWWSSCQRNSIQPLGAWLSVPLPASIYLVDGAYPYKTCIYFFTWIRHVVFPHSFLSHTWYIFSLALPVTSGFPSRDNRDRPCFASEANQQCGRGWSSTTTAVSSLLTYVTSSVK